MAKFLIIIFKFIIWGSLLIYMVISILRILNIIDVPHVSFFSVYSAWFSAIGLLTALS